MNRPYDQDAGKPAPRLFTYIGQLVEAGAWECSVCGALVLDRDMHHEWHCHE